MNLYIRKKRQKIKREYTDFFGYDVESLKMISALQFETFMEHKRQFEKQILDNKKIIISTVAKATAISFQKRKFRKIVMDEATMVKENLMFLAAFNAEQIILIGD